MLRGNYAAKIDDKGRLKIPNAFRALVEKTHGSELFVTSLTGESVRVYPMPVWLALEERLARAPSTHPVTHQVPRPRQLLRPDRGDRRAGPRRHPLSGSASPPGMAGEVDVFGQVDHLDVWNHERFVAKMQRDPYTDDDARALSEFGI